MLEVNETMIGESNAILRYVGRCCGLYPKDLLEALKVDEILDATEDLNKIENIVWNESGKN